MVKPKSTPSERQGRVCLNIISPFEEGESGFLYLPSKSIFCMNFMQSFAVIAAIHSADGRFMS